MPEKPFAFCRQRSSYRGPSARRDNGDRLGLRQAGLGRSGIGRTIGSDPHKRQRRSRARPARPNARQKIAVCGPSSPSSRNESANARHPVAKGTAALLRSSPLSYAWKPHPGSRNADLPEFGVSGNPIPVPCLGLLPNLSKGCQICLYWVEEAPNPAAQGSERCGPSREGRRGSK